MWWGEAYFVLTAGVAAYAMWRGSLDDLLASVLLVTYYLFSLAIYQQGQVESFASLLGALILLVACEYAQTRSDALVFKWIGALAASILLWSAWNNLFGSGDAYVFKAVKNILYFAMVGAVAISTWKHARLNRCSKNTGKNSLPPRSP